MTVAGGEKTEDAAIAAGVHSRLGSDVSVTLAV
jgi:hypothetical protein